MALTTHRRPSFPRLQHRSRVANHLCRVVQPSARKRRPTFAPVRPSAPHPGRYFPDRNPFFSGLHGTNALPWSSASGASSPSTVRASSEYSTCNASVASNPATVPSFARAPSPTPAHVQPPQRLVQLSDHRPAARTAAVRITRKHVCGDLRRHDHVLTPARTRCEPVAEDLLRVPVRIEVRGALPIWLRSQSDRKVRLVHQRSHRAI